MAIHCAILKVSKSRKQILKFSFEPKMTRKIWRISALCTVKTLRAEILQFFWVIFGSNENFKDRSRNRQGILYHPGYMEEWNIYLLCLLSLGNKHLSDYKFRDNVPSSLGVIFVAIFNPGNRNFANILSMIMLFY